MHRKGRWKGGGARFFPAVFRNNDRVNSGYKLERKRFPLNVRENIFGGMVTKKCPGSWWSVHH